MVRVHAGRLKFAPDPHPINLILGLFGDGRTLELNLSFVGPGPTGDQIEKSALTGPVRSNDRAKLALIEVKIQIVDRFEAVEAFRHSLSGEEEVPFHIGYLEFSENNSEAVSRCLEIL